MTDSTHQLKVISPFTIDHQTVATAVFPPPIQPLTRHPATSDHRTGPNLQQLHDAQDQSKKNILSSGNDAIGALVLCGSTARLLSI